MGFGRIVSMATVLLALLPCAGPAETWQADIFGGVDKAIIGVDDQSPTRRCVVANITQIEGRAFDAAVPSLEPGVYTAVLRLKLPMINNINTAPLHWTLDVHGAGKGRRDFDILTIERAGVYLEIPCRFVVARRGRVGVSLSWKRVSLDPETTAGMRVELDAMPDIKDMSVTDDNEDDLLGDLELEAELAEEPPIGGLHYLYSVVDAVTILPVSAVDVATLSVDKIRYKPGEQATVSVRVRNLAAGSRSLRVKTDFVNNIDTVIPVDERALELGAAAAADYTCQGPPFESKWGYAVRCRVYEGDKLLTAKQEYFTVHDNMWAILIAGRGAAQFTAHINRENAIKAAENNKARYCNWVESGFWAPDEFGDFTPDTENWWGGQGCYYGGVTGTKVHIEEGHKRGIAYAVYSNIWGGDGPPAFEMVRRRPDWGYASTFNVEWFERWDRNAMGRGIDKVPMHVWPITIIRHGGDDEPALHHAQELIDTHRMFGWDAVRYDSHAIADGTARIMDVVRDAVWAELPGFQFGYNSSVPRHDPSLTKAFKSMCEGEGGIMEEGIRQFGGGGMSFSGGATYEVFARRILDFKNEARENGGHFMAIGMDKCFPNDLVYQYIFWFAGNTHPCYDWPGTSVANYAQFATRFAGLIWDLNVKPMPDAAERLDVGAAADHLWLWPEYVHERDLGGGRRQAIVHLINSPAEKRLFTHDDAKVPEPLEKLDLSFGLPGPATVRGVWFLTAEPQLTQEALPHKVAAGRVTFTVPRVRFWSTVVIDMEGAAARSE